MRSDRAAWVLVTAALAGCSYPWDGLRPINGSPDVVVADVVDAMPGPDVVVVDATADVVTDRATPTDTSDVPMVQPDVVVVDRPMADTPDVSMVPDVPVVTDVPVVMDVPVIPDVPVAMDVPVIDVPDVPVIPDVPDVPVIVDVPDVPDTAMSCVGTLCPCATSTPAGWCTVGSTCMGGRCVAGTLAGSLVITEIMNDPAAVADMDGEWFEVYNPADTPVDIRNLRVRGGTAAPVVVTSTMPLVIAPRGYFVFARTADSAVNGGIPGTPYPYGTAFDLTNSTSTMFRLSLLASDGTTEIDGVTYLNTAGAGWSITPGVAKALRTTPPDATANDTPSNWCAAATTFGRGDRGTPGAPNVCP